MKTPARAAFGLAAAAATVTGAAHLRTAAAWTKPLPMAVLAAHAARTWRRRSMPENALLTGALAFSMAGDRAMLLEEFAEDERESDSRLKFGASLFGGAQLCYSALLYRRGGRPRLQAAAARSVLMAESMAVLATHRPNLIGVLGPYGSALGTTSMLAADIDHPQPAARAGGWLFLLSDLTIINRRYLLSDERMRAGAEAWVLASYFAAQYLLVTSLAD